MVRWLVLKQKATTWTVIATKWTLTLSDVVGVYGLGLGLGLGLGFGFGFGFGFQRIG